MRSLRAIILAAGSVAVMGIVGCGSSGEVYVADDQPQYLVVDQAPPPDPVEVIPASPGPDYLWVGGFYSWDGGSYHWQRGRWQVPPAGAGPWVAPQWSGGRFTPGHWQNARRGAAPAQRAVAPADRRVEPAIAPAQRAAAPNEVRRDTSGPHNGEHPGAPSRAQAPAADHGKAPAGHEAPADHPAGPAGHAPAGHDDHGDSGDHGGDNNK
jgi:hypothetical protein